MERPEHNKIFWVILFFCTVIAAAGGFFTAQFAVDTALAAEPDPDSPIEQLKQAGTGFTGGTSAAVPRDLRFILFDVVRGLLLLVGTTLLVVILYAGYMWWSAGGNEDKVDKAKSTLRNAVIGMVIITVSYALVNFLFRSVFAPATPTLEGTIEQIEATREAAKNK